MAKNRSKKNSFWERRVSHLPDGVDECLAFFPSSAFSSLEVVHANYSHSLINCEIVSDSIQNWILAYDNADESDHDTRKIIGDLLDFNGSPDAFLFAAVFFELTRWMRVNAFSPLEMSTDAEAIPKKIGSELSNFIDAYDTFSSDSLNLRNKLLDWSSVGFSGKVYADLAKEIDRIEKLMAQFNFYFPNQREVRIFKEKGFELVKSSPLDRKTIHRAVFYYNVFRLLRATTTVSDSKIYLFLSSLPSTVNVGPSGIKKLIQRVSKNKSISDWFNRRYKKIAKASLNHIESSALSRFGKSLGI